MAVDWMSLGKIIFNEDDKQNYVCVTDEDKDVAFFVLNRKFAYFDIKKAKFFNNKNIDRASSIDIWNNVFKNFARQPKWYYDAKFGKKSAKIKSPFKKVDVDDLKIRYNLSNNDIMFLTEYYIDDIKDTIKRLKKFKK